MILLLLVSEILSLPNLRPAFVCCLGHSTFVEHVVTYIAEDLKLLLTGESISLSTSADNLEHLTLGSDHLRNGEL